MKMRVLLVVFGIALVVAPAAITKTPKKVFAFGAGVRAPSCTDGCPAGTFSFNATSGPNGENPTGNFVIDFPGYAGFTGNVSCMHVIGHTATLFGQISTGTGAADPTTYVPDVGGPGPLYFVAVVTDTGKTKAGRPSQDKMSLVGWSTEAEWADSTVSPPGFTLAQVCSNPLEALANDNMFGLVSGDLTVIAK
jgi:hypothetical protein